MADPAVTLFLLAGASLAVGFLGSVLHRRTGVPDILILMFLGILLGPVLGLFDRATFEAATPYFAPLALIIILFDGGLNLSARSVARGLGVSVFHTALTFLGTMFVFYIVLNRVLGYAMLDSLALGAALGGPSGVVVLGIVQRVRASEGARVMMTMEAVITDVLCVVVALVLLGVSRGTTTSDPLGAMRAIGLGFGIAILTGLAAGLAWLGALRMLRGVRYAFVVTLAALLVLYGLTELAGGSGAVAALVFGLVIGNSEDISGLLRIDTDAKVDDSLKQFHSEVTFIVRTFFFIYLGVVFSLASLTNPGLLAVAIALIAGLLLIRAPVSAASGRLGRMDPGDWKVVTLMLPGGLAAAALVSILVAGMPDRGLASITLDLTLLIVLISAVAATIAPLLAGPAERDEDDADRLARRFSRDLEAADEAFMAKERARVARQAGSPKRP